MEGPGDAAAGFRAADVPAELVGRDRAVFSHQPTRRRDDVHRATSHPSEGDRRTDLARSREIGRVHV